MRLVGAVLLALLLAVAAGAQELTLTRYAGTSGGEGDVDGLTTSARFRFPDAIAADAQGNLYVVDRDLHVVRKITPEGRVTTLAGLVRESGTADGRGAGARFLNLACIAVDGSGNVYVGDSRKIRRISPEGVVTTFATEVEAAALTVDSLGNVFVSSYDHTIRKVTPQGVVSTLAGRPFMTGLQNGKAAEARFLDPRGIAVNANGDVFVADALNNVIRKITPAGDVSTFAGPTDYPWGLAFDAASGDLIVGSYGTNTIQRIAPDGGISTLAGTGWQGSRDGDAQGATFVFPFGVTVTPTGDVFVADAGNSVIRRIRNGSVETFAGNGGERMKRNGRTETARFAFPGDTVADSHGAVIAVDNPNLRKIEDGLVSTLAGSPVSRGITDGRGVTARFGAISEVVIDASDNVYASDYDANTIRKIAPDGTVTTLAGEAAVAGSSDGSGPSAHFDGPVALAIDSARNLYVADCRNDAIRKVTAAGEVTTIAGVPGKKGYKDAAKGSDARFDCPSSIAVDRAGNLYVGDQNGDLLRKITPALEVSTIAGEIDVYDRADGKGSAAHFRHITDIEVIGDDIYILDNLEIRQATPDGDITTLISEKRHGNVEGTGITAGFDYPTSLGPGPDGTLLISDAYSGTIMLAQRPGLRDAAATSSATPGVHTTIQLGTVADTATHWQWELIRRPSGSTAELSSTDSRTPTFTPDVADLFRFSLRASNDVGGVRFSIVDVHPRELCEPLASVVASGVASAAPTLSVCAAGRVDAAVSVNGGGDRAIQWGWRRTPGGATFDLAGSNEARLSVAAEKLDGLGTRYLVATVTSSCGQTLVSNPLPVKVEETPIASIVTNGALARGHERSVASTPDAGGGVTYSWSITNGTIESNPSARTIEYTGGVSGKVTLRVTVTRGACAVVAETSVRIGRDEGRGERVQ